MGASYSSQDGFDMQKERRTNEKHAGRSAAVEFAEAAIAGLSGGLRADGYKEFVPMGGGRSSM
jgi:hypothetical protein